ncbi:hypothetical protein [Streptacidiphilus neutrinimicus]|uniref:hypothetical protein n=1 Tax=Streptacidiphilus neutrinimicus TaxID=105420 RepID=UPI0005A78E3F|nr:hypothetical protein [Streptacidiphilus neutrinimicus]
MSQDQFAEDSTAADASAGTERIHVDHTVTKRLGNWTSADTFEIKARGGSVVVDLRSPNIPAQIEVRVEMQRAMVKLLVPEDAKIDQWGLQWSGRGKVKDGQAPTHETSRTIRLVGTAANSEIRVHRGGVAMVSAMMSREYFDDLRRARKEGRLPVIDDPTRDPWADPHGKAGA